MNKSKVDRLVEDTLESIDGINAITPVDKMFNSIMNSLKQTDRSLFKEKESNVKFAFAMAVIILINLIAIIGFQNKGNLNTSGDLPDKRNEINEFSKSYFSVKEEYNYFAK